MLLISAKPRQSIEKESLSEKILGNKNSAMTGRSNKSLYVYDIQRNDNRDSVASM